MVLGVNYNQAKELLDKYIKDPITKMHCLESEAIMRALAKKFDENEDEWGIIGLLHDIDWELTKNNPEEHCVKAVDILNQAGASDYLIETVTSHGYGRLLNDSLKSKQRTTKIQHALAAAETLTGLIVAAALVQPDKKLDSVKSDSLKKKFKSKSFAANCDRDVILECEKAGINLDKFLELGLKALQGISGKIGL